MTDIFAELTYKYLNMIIKDRNVMKKNILFLSLKTIDDEKF